MTRPWLRISERVRQALHERRPVIALESTIITHGIAADSLAIELIVETVGMPYPENHKTTMEIMRIMEDRGVTPAPIAIMHGQVQVGMEVDQLEELAKIGPKARKVSRRDIPFVLSHPRTQATDTRRDDYGATTVASTMLLAHQARIPLFVTGGIGGVHRDGHNSMDVSADLTELGRTPVGVVCAGAKSILDIPKTLEVLETQGVGVVTVSPDAKAEFPAFYTPKSGHSSPWVAESAERVAKIMHAHLQTQMQNGMVIAVPIPEQASPDAQLIQEAIELALKEAHHQGVTGKEQTPFLLKRVTELTQGRSLKANIELVKNNARVGSEIALELSRLHKQQK